MPGSARGRALFAVAAVAWLAGVVGLFYVRDRHIIAEEVSRGEERAREVSVSVDQLLGEDVEQLEVLVGVASNAYELRNFMTRAEADLVPRADREMLPGDREQPPVPRGLDGYLDQFMEPMPLLSIFVLDREGRLIGSSDRTLSPTLPTERSLDYRSFFRAMLKQQPERWLFFGAPGGDPYLFYAMPVRAEHRTLGTVIAAMPPQALFDVLPPDGPTIAITDGAGVVIMSTDPRLGLHRIGAAPFPPPYEPASRYGRADFPPLRFEKDALGSTRVSCACPLDGTIVAGHTVDLDESGGQLIVMSALPALGAVRAINGGFGLAVFASGLLLALFSRRVVGNIGRLRSRLSKDSLTGLFNRAHFDEIAPQLVAQHDRGSLSALSLVIADIDHFKRINDRYGHATGDQVLRGVGALLRQASRRDSPSFRIGGEEFAVLLPGAGLDAARAYAERIRSRVPGIGGGSRRVTLSAGVAERLPGEPLSDLMKRADRHLYEAKAGGRNRVSPGDEE